jgi:pimeloyl-ACP methyl ester carboxylesterase
MTTIASDWNDIGAVVDHVRRLRHVERVSLIGWSLGGPRAAGYASRNPEKVQSIVLLSPAYGRAGRAEPPAQTPARGAAFNTQSLDEFNANWDRQTGCADQVDPGARKAVWSQMLASDPAGATWGSGVRRAPQVTSWGWNAAVANKLMTPALLVSPALDKQVLPERVRELYADLGAPSKVLVDLACSSHNALWERNHLLLFQASLEWLTKHSVNGTKDAVVRLGY